MPVASQLLAVTLPATLQIALLIVMWLFVAGAGFKCVQWIRRPSANTLCAMSLLLATLGAGNFFTAVTLSQLVEPTWPVVELAAAGTLLLLVAGLLGIAGLVHWARHRDLYQQGVWQAGWAIGLSGVLSALAVAFILRQTYEHAAQPLAQQPAEQAEPATSQDADEAPATEDVTAITAPEEVDAEDEQEIQVEQSLEFDEQNFRYTLPGEPWQHVQPRAGSQGDVLVKLEHRNPHAILLVKAEKLTAGASANVFRMRDYVVQQIADRSSVADVREEEERVVGGLEGIQVAQVAMVNGELTRYVHWVGQGGGQMYHLVLGSRSWTQEETFEAAADLFGRFSLIRPLSEVEDPAELASAIDTDLQASVDPEGMRVFEELNFKFHLPDEPWKQVNPERTITDDARIALERTDPAVYLWVFAKVVEPGTSPDVNGILEAAKRHLDEAATAFELRDEHAHAVAGLDGTRIAMAAVVDGALQRYVNWVGTSSAHTYRLVVASPQLSQDELVTAAAELFERFELIRPVGELGDAMDLAAAQDGEGRALAKRGNERIHETLNFAYQMPPTRWEMRDPAEIEHDPLLFFLTGSPKIGFRLQAFQEALELDADLELAVNRYRDGYEAAPPVPSWVGEERREVNGIEGRQLEWTMPWQGQTQRTIAWIGYRNGYSYQLEVWTFSASRDRLRAAADEMFPLLRQLDADRVAPPVPPLADVENPRYAFRVRLTDSPWLMRVIDVAQDSKTCFKAERADHGGDIVVLAYWMFGEDPPLDGLAKQFFDPERDELRDYHTIEVHADADPPHKLFGWIDNGTEVRARVIKQGGFAYVIVASGDYGAADVSSEQLDRALDMVEFIPLEREFELEEATRGDHASLINALGIYAYEARDYAAAARYSRRAFNLDPSEACLFNVVKSLEMQGRLRDGLFYLEEHIESVPSSAQLQLQRARLQDRLGNRRAALATFESLFATGYRDDDAVMEYVDVLYREGRLQEAVQMLEAYVAEGASTPVHMQLAECYRFLHEHDRAIDVLLAEQQRVPFNLDLVMRLTTIYFDARRYEEMLATVHRILEQGQRSPQVYLAKGQAEYGLGRFQEAQRSFELALRDKPDDSTLKIYLELAAQALKTDTTVANADGERLATAEGAVDTIHDQIGRGAAFFADGEWSSDEFNFAFEAPPSGWYSVTPSLFNADATLALAHFNPNMFLTVSAAQGVQHSILDLDALAKTMRTAAESSESGEELVSEQRRNLGGVDGLLFEWKEALGDQRVHKFGWVGVHNGFLFQLTAWTVPPYEEALRSASDELFARFRLLDPSRHAPVDDAPNLVQIDHSRYGYAVDQQRGDWVFSEEHFGKYVVGGTLSAGSKLVDASFYLLPVYLFEEDLSLEDVAQVLLARMNFVYPGDELQSVDKRGDANPPEYIYHGQRQTESGPRDVRLRVVKHDGFAYLMAAFAAPGALQKVPQALDESLSLVRLIRAPPLVNLSGDELRSHAEFFDSAGLIAFASGDHAAALRHFIRAFEFEHKNPAYLRHVLAAHRELGQLEEALAYLDQQGGKFSNNTDLQLERADLQIAVDDYLRAIETYEAVFNSGYRNDGAFYAFASLLVYEDRLDDAIARVEAYLEEGGATDLHVLLASGYRHQQRFDEALELLLAEQQRVEFNLDLALQLGEVYHDVERFDDMLAEANRLVERGYRTADVYWLKGRAEHGLDRLAAAKASLELALKAAPGDEGIMEAIEVVSAQLGEGDNSAVKTPIAAVETPAAIRQVLRSEASTPPEECDAFYVERSTAIEFVPGERYRTTQDSTVEIVRRAGLEYFSTFEEVFDGVAERIYVNHLTVRDAQGNVVVQGDPSTYYVLDSSASEEATNDRILHVPVPGLEVGYRIEYQVTREDISPPDRFPFIERVFSDGFPIRSRLLYVQAPLETLAYDHSEGIKPETVAGGIYWLVQEPPVYQYEQYQPDLPDFLPTVWLAGADAAWEEIAAEYYSAVADRLSSQPELTELARRLAGEDADQAARILAAADYVQEHLQYRAIEFGVRGRRPNDGLTTLHNRYGDCKDHSVLLHQLLTAIGIESQLALARTDGPIAETLPDLDQFNHMVVYVPQYQNGHVFDCTGKENDLRLTPVSLAGQKILRLAPGDEGGLVEVPTVPANADYTDCRREIAIAESGDVTVREAISFHGYHAAVLRSHFKALDASTQKTSLADFVAPDGTQAVVTALAIEGLEDKQQGVTLRAVYRIPAQFLVTGDALVGRVPCAWDDWYLDISQTAPRQTPMELRMPINLVADVFVRPPPDWQFDDLTPWNDAGNEHLVNWNASAADEDHGVRFKYTVRIARGSMSAAQHASFEQALDRPLSLLRRRHVLRKP